MSPDSVVVYRTVESAPQHVEVAIVEADGGNLYGQGALLRKLREKTNHATTLRRRVSDGSIA